MAGWQAGRVRISQGLRNEGKKTGGREIRRRRGQQTDDTRTRREQNRGPKGFEYERERTQPTQKC